jgi:hypothetical protein
LAQIFCGAPDLLATRDVVLSDVWFRAMALLPALRLQAKYFPVPVCLHGAAFIPMAGGPKNVWDNGMELTVEIFCVADWIGSVARVLCDLYHDTVIDPDASPLTAGCKI